MRAKDKWDFQFLGEKMDWEAFNHNNILSQHIVSAEAGLPIKIPCERFQNTNNSEILYSLTNYQHFEKPWSVHVAVERWTHPGLRSNKSGDDACNAKGGANWKLFKYDA